MSESDVRFMTTNLNVAARDAAATTEVYGPTVVYSRDAVQWQAEHAQPYKYVTAGSTDHHRAVLVRCR